MHKVLADKIDKTMFSFLNELTKELRNEPDIEMLYDIINGKRFENGRTAFKFLIGSARRLEKSNFDDLLPALFYNEFKIQLRVTADSFHLMACLFHNEENKTEGFSYNYNTKEGTDSGVPENTWVLPEGEHDRSVNKCIQDIIDLLKLNREIRTSSVVGASEETYLIQKQFDELMKSASDEEISWALNNELEKNEKIRVLKNLSTDRKLQIIQNLKK